MNFKKAATIAAAAGALAAISVPAMALENEFHGYYTLRGYVSNYNDAAANDLSPTALGKDNKANKYAEQRARIFYTGKTSEDLKLVTAFELDTRFGGVTNGKYTSTSDAGVLDGDGINLETKWAYLDFNATNKVNVKTGLMPYKDSIKGLFIDADVPAIYTTTKLDALTIGAGYSRVLDANQTNDGLIPTKGVINTPLGARAKDLFILDANYAVSKDLKAGLSYYLLYNNQTVTAATAAGVNATGTGYTLPAAASDSGKTLLLHTIALNGEAKVGPATVSGFAAIQTGKEDVTGIEYSGYALNVAAKLPIGPGTAKTAILYTSGDGTDAKKKTGWVGSTVSSYNESGLMLLVRNNATSGTTTTNEFVRRNISNVGLYTIGYDAKISPKAYVNANLGIGWAPKNDITKFPNVSATKAVNVGTGYLGTEIALEGGYKVYDNLTASVQAAYLALGDTYKNSNLVGETPENPYTARVVLTYAF